MLDRRLTSHKFWQLRLSYILQAQIGRAERQEGSGQESQAGGWIGLCFGQGRSGGGTSVGGGCHRLDQAAEEEE